VRALPELPDEPIEASIRQKKKWYGYYELQRQGKGRDSRHNLDRAHQPHRNDENTYEVEKYRRQDTAFGCDDTSDRDKAKAEERPTCDEMPYLSQARHCHSASIVGPTSN
jgi:hypothetical protein